MKGTLHKTEQGWVVKYAKHSELPLHPEYVKCYFLDEDAEGGEVEFEIVSEPNIYRSVGNIQENYTSYAKLIPLKEQQKQEILYTEERIRETLKDSFSKGVIVQTGFDTNEESENMFIDKFIQSLKQPK